MCSGQKSQSSHRLSVVQTSVSYINIMERIKWLPLFKDIITVYSENYIKPKIQNADLLIVKLGGTYSKHWVLNG
jgi:hypothetical protein